MIISHSKKFIFIHIYKTGGTSVVAALGGYCIHTRHLRNPLTRLKILTGIYPKIYSQDYPRHITANDLKMNIDAEIFEKYFKFAFVRNPWDWQVSLYHYAIQYPDHHEHALTKSFPTFRDYIEWRVKDNVHLQKDRIYDKNGKQVVDFVGKMENLKSDLDAICKFIGVPSRTIPHINKTKRKDYQSYYNSYTRELVREYFREDIETFGYSF